MGNLGALGPDIFAACPNFTWPCTSCTTCLSWRELMIFSGKCCNAARGPGSGYFLLPLVSSLVLDFRLQCHDDIHVFNPVPGGWGECNLPGQLVPGPGKVRWQHWRATRAGLPDLALCWDVPDLWVWVPCPKANMEQFVSCWAIDGGPMYCGRGQAHT